MKGIILAGGSGTRLYPLTEIVCKQLLPIFDKPMIYYPLSLLMLAGVREILIISTPKDVPSFEALFGDGKRLGLSIQYAIQERPTGLPEAFVIGADFIAGDQVMMILGDNIFYGDSFINKHVLPALKTRESTVFAYSVGDPERYGVVEFDREHRIVSIEEKPKVAKSSYALTGMYIFDANVSDVARNVKPSPRGETEIVEVIKHYWQKRSLRVEVLGRGVAWLDTGTHESLLEASLFVQVLEKRQGMKIACLEEIAFRSGYVSLRDFKALTAATRGTYREYLERTIRLEEEGR